MSLSLKQQPIPSESLSKNNHSRRPSLSDFADQFETAVRERNEFAGRLDASRQELEAVSQLYQQVHKEFENERNRLHVEISSLRTQITDLTKKLQRPQGDLSQTLLATKEKLIRDEFERKYQELAAEVRRQRKSHTEQVDKMKAQLDRCICRASR